MNKIVRKIEFISREKDRSWKSPLSGYGTISKINAIYRVDDLSIN